MAKNRVKDSLFAVFQREKDRVNDRFTVFYNQKEHLLQYFNDEGTLTVLFDEKKGAENFYYKSRGIESNSKYGTLIQQTADHGHKAVFTKEIFNLCSQNFIDLCADYQYNRESIGIEKAFKREKPRSAFERD